MAELVTQVPEVALAVYAHPDDADVGCGGTLALWATRGSAVHLVVCTDGGRGTPDPAVHPADLARRRAGELASSAETIGLASHRMLGASDGELAQRPTFVGELVALVRSVRPEVVLGHDPTAVFFGQEYFNHRDHRAAGWALLDALSPSAALPHYFPEAGPPHQVSAAYLSGTLEPDVWVDISETVGIKAAAVECHRSQFAGAEVGWAGEAVRRRAEEEGRRAGVVHAEGFRRLRLGG
ncbi:MAG TPA: PIG-L deacetylase family protein [Acidimicrobiales bacterium]|nr:PIG-L deacetylase family protein [Acidimicrobiales bacterium]